MKLLHLIIPATLAVASVAQATPVTTWESPTVVTVKGDYLQPFVYEDFFVVPQSAYIVYSGHAQLGMQGLGSFTGYGFDAAPGGWFYWYDTGRNRGLFTFQLFTPVGVPEGDVTVVFIMGLATCVVVRRFCV